MNGIRAMKKDSLSEAKTFSLSVLDVSGKEIALLIPIGNWALTDEGLVNSFANWRKTFMRFFLTQFTASKESTKGYLKNFSIGQDDRIFFAIYVDELLIGHIGLNNVSESKAELDNVIRGVSGGHKDLMYFAEKTLLSWAFNSLNLKTIEAQVMSKNFMALSLHGRFGFKLSERKFLKKVVSDKSVIYDPCGEDCATERFFLDRIEVTKSEFARAITCP